MKFKSTTTIQDLEQALNGSASVRYTPKANYDDSVCNCHAEEYPHRFGFGGCEAEQGEPMCEECGKSCSPVACDDGVGLTEFWGYVSNDVRPYLGSSCCHAQILNPCTMEVLDEK